MVDKFSNINPDFTDMSQRDIDNFVDIHSKLQAKNRELNQREQQSLTSMSSKTKNIGISREVLSNMDKMRETALTKAQSKQEDVVDEFGKTILKNIDLETKAIKAQIKSLKSRQSSLIKDSRKPLEQKISSAKASIDKSLTRSKTLTHLFEASADKDERKKIRKKLDRELSSRRALKSTIGEMEEEAKTVGERAPSSREYKSLENEISKLKDSIISNRITEKRKVGSKAIETLKDTMVSGKIDPETRKILTSMGITEAQLNNVVSDFNRINSTFLKDKARIDKRIMADEVSVAQNQKELNKITGEREGFASPEALRREKQRMDKVRRGDIINERALGGNTEFVARNAIKMFNESVYGKALRHTKVGLGVASEVVRGESGFGFGRIKREHDEKKEEDRLAREKHREFLSARRDERKQAKDKTSPDGDKSISKGVESGFAKFLKKNPTAFKPSAISLGTLGIVGAGVGLASMLSGDGDNAKKGNNVDSRRELINALRTKQVENSAQETTSNGNDVEKTNNVTDNSNTVIKNEVTTQGKMNNSYYSTTFSRGMVNPAVSR